MSQFINPRALLVALVLVFGGIVGFSFFGLPFIPDAGFSDAVVSHWPAALFTRDMLLNAAFPLWRDTILGGAPFAANPLNKTAYPPQLLLLILPPLTHLNLMLIAHVTLGMVGMWAWARWSGLSTWAAAVGALAYGLAPRLVGQMGAGHLDIVYAMSWFPWLMALVYRGVGERGRVVYGLQLALVGAFLVLADVRVGLYAGLLTVGYALWRSAQTRTANRIIMGILALTVFVTLTVSLTVPLLGWSDYLSRSALTVDDVSVFSLEPMALAGLLLPTYEGNIETLIYLGVAVFVLTGIGLASRPTGERVFWGGVLIVAVLWAMGTNTPVFRALMTFDVLRWFRVPARAWLVVVLIAAYLSAHGLHTLMMLADDWRENPPPKHVFWLRLLAAGFTGLLALCGGLLLFTTLVDLPQAAALILLVNGAGLALVLMSVLLRRGRSTWVALGMMTLIFVDSTVSGVHWIEWRSPQSWLGEYMPLADRILQESPMLIYSPDYALPQQIAAWTGMRLFYGVDPFQISGMVSAIEAASNVPVTNYSVVQPPLTGIDDDDPVLEANRGIMPNLHELARWQVSHVVSGYPMLHPDLTRVAVVDDIYIYRNEAFIRMDFDPTLPAYFDELPTPETIDRLNRWTVIAAGVAWGALVLTVGALLFLIRKGRTDDA